MYFIYITLALISVLPHISSVELLYYTDWNDITPMPRCSSKVITRVESCSASQPCGRCGVSYPLDSCQLEFIGHYSFIDNLTERGYNTVFRFKEGEETVQRVGTFALSFRGTQSPDQIGVDVRYLAPGQAINSGQDIYFEIHPHYFSDLKLKISAVSEITATETCPASTDLQNTHDCGRPGRSQLFCPVYQRLYNEQMCDKCYKATFGVKGKKYIQHNIAGVVEYFVKVVGASERMEPGYFYHISNDVANAVVSAVCETACSADDQYFCPSEADAECTEVAASEDAFAQAVHEFMYLREINCDNFLEIDDPICETKSNRGGFDRYKSSEVIFNSKTGRPSCDCSNAAEWNVKTQLCDLVCDSIQCTGSNEVPGSCKAFFNKRNFACTCQPGYTWNPATRECVARTVAPVDTCRKVCPNGQHCVHWPGDPSLPQKCVCDENSTQLAENGECVPFADFYAAGVLLI